MAPETSKRTNGGPVTEVLFLVNAVEQATADQTTAGLVAAMSRRRSTWVTEIRGLRHTPGGLRVAVHPVPPTHDPHDVPRALRAAPEEHELAAFDALWVRLNPGRMAAAGMVGVLETLVQVEDAGVFVHNAATGLLRAASKLYLASLPADTIARTWSARDPGFLRACIAELDGPAVVKPAIGSRGGDVHLVPGDSAEVGALLERLVGLGPVLVQEYLPEARDGDLRVHLVGGKLLEAQGQAAAVRRVPAAGEWRSNVALGGTPAPGAPSPGQRRLVERVGPILARHGLWHVGLDIVGDRVVECNVFSPGGLADASRFAAISFEDLVVERFLSAVERSDRLTRPRSAGPPGR